MAAAAPPSPFTSPAPSPSTSASASDVLPELPLFVAKEAYVYQVPPATTAGHRAETWNVNNWLATVSLKVLQADDECLIRLVEEKTGELFAECPIPTDHRPLTTAVEPVIDSSRYFVLRIVDRDSQRHAFIGIGFRERNEASDFNAALHEYLQYIKRKRIAEAMRHAHEERAQAAEAGPDAEASPAAAPQADYSIKDGETLHLKISAPKPAGAGGFVSRAAARGHMGKSFSLLLDGHGGSVAALSPPPRRGSDSGLDMCVSPCLEASSPAGSPMHADGGAVGASPLGPTGRLSGTGDAELQQRLQGLHLQSQAGSESSRAASCSGSVASTSTAAAAAADEEVDEFGDFEAAADLTAGEEEVLQAPSEAGQAPS